MADLVFPENYRQKARRVYRSRKNPDWVVYELKETARFARGSLVRYTYTVEWVPQHVQPDSAAVRPNLILCAGLLLPWMTKWDVVAVKEYRPRQGARRK